MTAGGGYGLPFQFPPASVAFHFGKLKMVIQIHPNLYILKVKHKSVKYNSYIHENKAHVKEIKTATTGNNHSNLT